MIIIPIAGLAVLFIIGFLIVMVGWTDSFRLD